jgi:hypothetical protein
VLAEVTQTEQRITDLWESELLSGDEYVVEIVETGEFALTPSPTTDTLSSSW